MSVGDKLPVVVLISGSGSNLQALIDRAAAGAPYEVSAVISNKPGVQGLSRAQQAGIPTRVLDHRRFADRSSFDAALAELIDDFEPGLVVLAGFMRILTPAFVRRYAGRLLNIHPSLLPRYQGLNTHARAIEAGDTEAGASVHFVTEELDGGPVVAQARVPVLPQDTPQTLAERVLRVEHQLYPQVVQWFAAGRLRLGPGHIELDGQPLYRPLTLELACGEPASS
jgi:phosphoribosylglycinamide formyltransferase-1